MLITFFADIALPPSEFVSVKIQSAARLVKWQRETFAGLPAALPQLTIINAGRGYSERQPQIQSSEERGLEEVPRIVVNLAAKEEEDAYIVEANRARVKTASQIYNEGRKLKEAYAALEKKKKTVKLKISLSYGENISSRFVEESSTDKQGQPTKSVTKKTRSAIAEALDIKEHHWKCIEFVGRYAELGNETAIEALRLLDKGSIASDKGMNMVRAALRKEQAENSDKPEREPTYMDICISGARKQAVRRSRKYGSPKRYPGKDNSIKKRWTRCGAPAFCCGGI